MAVGTGAITCYQGEDVSWEWTFTDDEITSIAGWTIRLVIKLTPAAVDPALIGPITCSLTSTASPMTFLAAFNVDLDPGTYNVSVRRVNSGYSWQLVDAPLTVRDSGSID